MKSNVMAEARNEIDASLSLSYYSMHQIGLSFIKPKTTMEYFKQNLMFVLSISSICYLVFSEIVYIVLMLSKDSPPVEEVVPLFHILGYGTLSISKLFVLWYKRDTFANLLNELAEIWPMPPINKQYLAIKDKSLDALRMTHRWYFYINIVGLWFYNIQPIGLYLFQTYIQGKESNIGFVWVSWYPFDKYQPVAHFFVYIYEVFAGKTSVWIMVCTDLLFSGMASHIGLLLKILHRQLENIGTTAQSDDEQYEEIKNTIKLHQRLIKYCNDLEDAFSLSNLINIVLSSVNICCVVFVIVLLEPLMVVSSKFYLVSALIQIGMICWYADDIYHANAEVAQSAYNSLWYRTNPKSQRALLYVIKRSQNPIAFTAMKFTNISLITYTTIIKRSYSYFALLYTMYNGK